MYPLLLTTHLAGTSFAMTAPAAMTEPEPIRTPGVTVTLAPIQTFDSMTIGTTVTPSKRSAGSTGWPAVLRAPHEDVEDDEGDDVEHPDDDPRDQGRGEDTVHVDALGRGARVGELRPSALFGSRELGDGDHEANGVCKHGEHE